MADRDHVLKLLGGEVGTLQVAEAKTDANRPLENGTLETLILRISDGSEAPAFLLLPPDIGPSPAILYCHAHGNRYDIGRDELIAGRPALTAPYAPDLLARGYAVLCVEMPCFGTPGTHVRIGRIQGPPLAWHHALRPDARGAGRRARLALGSP